MATAMIQQISDTEFQLVKGGHTMTLTHDQFGWHMITVNAATRAWGGVGGVGGLGPGFGFRRFDSLKAVEAHYKSWRGITALVSA